MAAAILAQPAQSEQSRPVRPGGEQTAIAGAEN